MGRFRPHKQLRSPVALPKEGERKVSGRTGYRTPDLWLLSQTLRLMVYAKFQYSLNVLFCEPTEICEYKRNLYMYRVSEFGLLSSNHTGVGIGIFDLTFLETLIHDSKYGDKRLNNNAICLVDLNKRAKLILPNLLVDWSNLTVIDSAYLLPP